VLNSFVLCYFVTDDAYLAKMLLSSLAIYLSTLYTLIRERNLEKRKPAYYNLLRWFYFQRTYWRHCKGNDVDVFSEAGHKTGLSDTFQYCHDLRYSNRNPGRSSAERIAAAWVKALGPSQSETVEKIAAWVRILEGLRETEEVETIDLDLQEEVDDEDDVMGLFD